MADVTRAAFSPDGSNPTLPKLSGLLAGEALVAGDAVYVKSDGKLWQADGGAADAEAKFIGLAATSASSGAPCTVLLPGWRCKYGTGLTIGAAYYVSATDGALADAASTGGTTVVAKAVSATDILILNYQV